MACALHHCRPQLREYTTICLYILPLLGIPVASSMGAITSGAVGILHAHLLLDISSDFYQVRTYIQECTYWFSLRYEKCQTYRKCERLVR